MKYRLWITLTRRINSCRMTPAIRQGQIWYLHRIFYAFLMIVGCSDFDLVTWWVIHELMNNNGIFFLWPSSNNEVEDRSKITIGEMIHKTASNDGWSDERFIPTSTVCLAKCLPTCRELRRLGSPSLSHRLPCQLSFLHKELQTLSKLTKPVCLTDFTCAS